MLSHMWNLKKNDTNELICKTETVDPHWLSQPQRLNICFEKRSQYKIFLLLTFVTQGMVGFI